MSTALFSASPGTAVRFETPGDAISMEIRGPLGNENILAMDALLVTGVGFDLTWGAQYQLALSQRVHVYRFGQQPGQFQLTGVLFYRVCGKEKVDQAGIGVVLSKFKELAGSTSPSTIAFGEPPFALIGYVDRVRNTFSDPAAGVLGFVMDMTVIAAGP